MSRITVQLFYKVSRNSAWSGVEICFRQKSQGLFFVQMLLIDPVVSFGFKNNEDFLIRKLFQAVQTI